MPTILHAVEIQRLLDNVTALPRLLIFLDVTTGLRQSELFGSRCSDLEFDNDEIRTFVQGWRSVHEPDQAAAVEKGEALWKQGESVEQLAGGVALQIRRAELERRLERFLREKGAADTLNLVETIVDRLHARDAVLVQYGGDQFGFVHRSFQE